MFTTAYILISSLTSLDITRSKGLPALAVTSHHTLGLMKSHCFCRHSFYYNHGEVGAYSGAFAYITL